MLRWRRFAGFARRKKNAGASSSLEPFPFRLNRNRGSSRGIAFGILRAPWVGFAIVNEMDSTGLWMIRDAGDGFGSLYRMLGGFGRPAHGQCRAARLP